MEMSIKGTIKQTRVFGPNLELKRTISGTIGEASIKVNDEVINRGNTAVPHMLLYHFNFGWPLVNEGSDIIWKGTWQAREDGKKNRIFTEGNNFRKCISPLEEHSGGNEEACLIQPASDDSGYYTCGLHNEEIGIAVALKLKKKQLPWLTNWQHWGKGEYVTGLEPGTNPPIGQTKARKKKTLLYLSPGETKTYDLKIEVLNKPAQIKSFLKNNNQGI